MSILGETLVYIRQRTAGKFTNKICGEKNQIIIFFVLAYINSCMNFVFSRDAATLYERVSVRPLVGRSVALSLFGLLRATYAVYTH